MTQFTSNAMVGTIEKQNGKYILEVWGCAFPIPWYTKVDEIPLSDEDLGSVAIWEGNNLRVTCQKDDGTDEGLEAAIEYARKRLEQGLLVA